MTNLTALTKLSDERVAELRQQADRLRSSLNTYEIEAFRELLAPAEPTVEQMLALAVEMERAQVRQVIADVDSIAGDRTTAYWAGHAQACEEIQHRLSQAWGVTCEKCKEIAGHG